MFAERLVCALGLAAGAFGQTYVQFSVDNGAIPSSINEKGEIAGTYFDSANGFHGFVRDPGGKITAFDVPGSFGSTRATSINGGGAITGLLYFDANLRTHGFIRDPEGNFTTFDPPGSISTVPQSINARGFISGFYNESNLVSHGFVREPSGHIISFDVPDSIATQAFGINAGGAITGFYVDANQRVHGFVRDPEGNFTTFDPPDSLATRPANINNAGAITGDYTKPQPFPSNPRVFGFVRHPDGKFTSFDLSLLPPFNSSLVGETFPTSINNEGAITGFVESNDLSVTHGFVRSPKGTSVVFDPPFCFPGSTTSGFIVDRGTGSINDKGVATGACSSLTPPFSALGWVRFP